MAAGPVRECARFALSPVLYCSKYRTERNDGVSVPAEGKEASCTCAFPSRTATELLVVPKSNPTARWCSSAVRMNPLFLTGAEARLNLKCHQEAPGTGRAMVLTRAAYRLLR